MFALMPQFNAAVIVAITINVPLDLVVWFRMVKPNPNVSAHREQVAVKLISVSTVSRVTILPKTT